MSTNIKVTQYTSFDESGAISEAFQIEVAGLVVEDLTREELKRIEGAIDAALLYGCIVPEKKVESEKEGV